MGLIGFILEFLSLSKVFLAWEQPKFLDAIHHWFPHEITSEERREIPPYSWRVTTKIWSCFWLVVPPGKFASTNQGRYSDLYSDISSVWNFCSRSEVIRKGSSDYVAKYRLF